MFATANPSFGGSDVSQDETSKPPPARECFRSWCLFAEGRTRRGEGFAAFVNG